MASVKEYLNEQAALEGREQAINDLVLALYKENRQFVPHYPWVFVRVLPKEQVVGGIVVPTLNRTRRFMKASYFRLGNRLNTS